MATFYGTENTKGRTVPPTLSDGGKAGGRVRTIVDDYTVTSATHGNGTIITFGRQKLPKGATILDITVGMAGTSAGSGRTLSLGYDGATTAFASAAAVATTGTVVRASVGGGIGLTMTDDEYLIGTTGGGAFATGAKINVVVFYTID